MRSLILHPTEVSQWQAIVNEAEACTQLILSEDTESYLVFLLIRFTKKQELVESVVALDFLESVDAASSTVRIERLQEVGDKSLLLCGLFPGIARKRRVNLTYFSDLGQAAYHTASGHQNHPYAALFEKLGHQFLNLQQILQALQQLPATESIIESNQWFMDHKYLRQ